MSNKMEFKSLNCIKTVLVWQNGFVAETFLLVLAINFVTSQSVPNCGIIDENAAMYDPRAKAPWTAALYFQSTQCDFRPAGNGHGVIIGPTTVLIKGNFMWSNDGYGGLRMEGYSPNHFMVAAGLKSKVPFVADQHTQFLKVANVQPHFKSYNAFSEFDYAIIHLKTPFQFTSFVQPICLENMPEGIFERSNTSLLNDYLTITGFRTGSSNFRSSVQIDKENFGLLGPEFCSSQLEWELYKATSAPKLMSANTPCGVSIKSVENTIDVRSINGDKLFLHLQQLFNYTKFHATAKDFRPKVNMCFHNGAAITTKYLGRWHLVGLVTESLGVSCEKNMYFVSFVGSKSNMNWILQHIRYSPEGFICSNDQNIHLETNVCNGQPDCVDGSDEDEKMCTCTPMCGTTRCLLQPLCKTCGNSDTLEILKQKYKYLTNQVSTKIQCDPVFAPADANVHCKAPGKQLIPCDDKHWPGSQAVFTCKRFELNHGTFCTITCQQNGKWTDELSSFNCKVQTQENVVVTERSNISNSNVTPFPIIRNPTTTSSNSQINFGDTYKNGTILCSPLFATTGTKISCWSSSASTVSCSDAVKPGVKAEFTCSRYYKPLLNTASVIKQCQPDGSWSLDKRKFECRLDCGIPKRELIGHIVNGRETDGSKWPWHGLIFFDLGQHNYTYICGSTLVSRRILITAAHCVTDHRGNARNASLFKVVLAASSNVYLKNIFDKEIQAFDISKVVVQPLFNLANFEADIAVLQLSKPVEISDYVRPSCYPSINSHIELKHLSPGSVGQVVGFGYDETGKPSKTLREASLPVVSYKDCLEVSKIQHSATQYCSGYTNGTAVCNGDSGSGMFFEEEIPQRRVYLQGIVSHGNREESSRLCDHKQYSVFTKVGSFKDWISENGYELDDEF